MLPKSFSLFQNKKSRENLYCQINIQLLCKLSPTSLAVWDLTIFKANLELRDLVYNLTLFYKRDVCISAVSCSLIEKRSLFFSLRI